MLNLHKEYFWLFVCDSNRILDVLFNGTLSPRKQDLREISIYETFEIFIRTFSK